MFKVLLLGVGFAVAYLAIMAGEYLSPLIMTGSMPLAVIGISLPANAVQIAYYASLVVVALGAIFTIVATIGYIVNWFFNGWQNPNTIHSQIAFLMLVLAESLFGFGAVAKPFSLYGNNPLDWLGSPYLWLLVAAFVPSIFLLMNLVVEAIQWHLRPNPLEREIRGVAKQVEAVATEVNNLASNLQTHRNAFDDRMGALEARDKAAAESLNAVNKALTDILARLPPPQPHVVADNAPKAPETKVA